MNNQINNSNNSNIQSPQEIQNSMPSHQSIQKNSNIHHSHLSKTLKDTSREHSELKNLWFQLYSLCTKYDNELQKNSTQTKAIQNIQLCKLILQEINELIKDVVYDIQIDQDCNRAARFMKVKEWFNAEIWKLQFIRNTIKQNPQHQISNLIGSLILFRGLLVQSTCQTQKIKFSQIISESQKKEQQQPIQIQSLNNHLQKSNSYSKLQNSKSQ